MAFSLSFKSVGHFFATTLEHLASIEKTQATVEAVTSVIPGVGVDAVTIEKAAYALLGEVTALFSVGEQAAADKLGNAGLDVNVINQVKAVTAQLGQLKAVVQNVK